MKRSKQLTERHVYISRGGVLCCKCKHDRKGEPYVKFVYYGPSGRASFEQRCWRCCRDAESTFLIKRKWPLAFVRFEFADTYKLLWSPGVKALVGEHEKV